MRIVAAIALLSRASLGMQVAPAFAIQLPSKSGISVEIERLVGLARVWGQVNDFHPALGYRSDFDWDSALVTAIPGVRTAASSLEYAAAVQAMLAAVEDPLTRVLT